jgi:hypothetical protein
MRFSLWLVASSLAIPFSYESSIDIDHGGKKSRCFLIGRYPSVRITGRKVNDEGRRVWSSW